MQKRGLKHVGLAGWILCMGLKSLECPLTGILLSKIRIVSRPERHPALRWRPAELSWTHGTSHVTPQDLPQCFFEFVWQGGQGVLIGESAELTADKTVGKLCCNHLSWVNIYDVHMAFFFQGKAHLSTTQLWGSRRAKAKAKRLLFSLYFKLVEIHTVPCQM